ncbi:MAG: ribonuclease P protein component 1 [Methanoregulaceae archaeon]|jgi:ribonuclease P protein subunit POP4|nr:ribonuclease P protein component 1 [Methanoregulaceae archaeon]MDD5684601.1 ribonuclease P protein component 1 [Methanoregulaceae archaeon]
MISSQNVLRHELIGLDVLVVSASNPTQVGISGRIIDETRNTLVILGVGGQLRVPKRFSIFRLTLPGGVRVEIDGSVLVMPPERRINMYWKNRGK